MSTFNVSRDDPHRYDDILDLPHHVSDRHPPMSMSQRAAMFHPYEALSGFGEKLREVDNLLDHEADPGSGRQVPRGPDPDPSCR